MNGNNLVILFVLALMVLYMAVVQQNQQVVLGNQQQAIEDNAQSVTANKARSGCAVKSVYDFDPYFSGYFTGEGALGPHTYVGNGGYPVNTSLSYGYPYYLFDWRRRYWRRRRYLY